MKIQIRIAKRINTFIRKVMGRYLRWRQERKRIHPEAFEMSVQQPDDSQQLFLDEWTDPFGPRTF